jgi:hypothetical protein
MDVLWGNQSVKTLGHSLVKIECQQMDLDRKDHL